MAGNGAAAELVVSGGATWPAGTAALIEERVSALMSRLGLPTRFACRVEPGAGPVEVRVDGRPCVLSARRRQAVAGSLEGSEADELAAGVVEAALQANLAALVRREAAALGGSAEAALADGVLADGVLAQGVLAEALVIAAEWGAVPGSLLPAVAVVEADADPWVLAHRLVAASAASLAPVVELSAATAASLAEEAGPAVGGVPAWAEPAPGATRATLHGDLGVVLPFVASRIVDLPDDVVRIRIGGLEWCHRLIAPGTVVLSNPPRLLPASWDPSPFCDPDHGGVWSLVPVAAAWSGYGQIPAPSMGYRSYEYLNVVLAAEVRAVAALFLPDDPLPLSAFSAPLAEQVARRFDPVRRALVADGAGTATEATVAEAIVRSLADGSDDVAASLSRARALIMSGVVSQLRRADDHLMTVVDLGQVDRAMEAGDPRLLLPDGAAGSTLDVLVICPGPRWAEVRALLRPLYPSVLVAADHEVPPDQRDMLAAFSSRAAARS